MTNLKELVLYYDILSRSHPSLARALTAFKSIQRLDLYRVHFSTFGHCARLTQSFPHLDHLGFRYLSWKPLPPGAPHPPPLPSVQRGKSNTLHLDLWSSSFDGSEPSDLSDFTKWFTRFQDHSTLRTLSLDRRDNGSVQPVLPCWWFIRSVFTSRAMMVALY